MILSLAFTSVNMVAIHVGLQCVRHRFRTPLLKNLARRNPHRACLVSLQGPQEAIPEGQTQSLCRWAAMLRLVAILTGLDTKEREMTFSTTAHL